MGYVHGRRMEVASISELRICSFSPRFEGTYTVNCKSWTGKRRGLSTHLSRRAWKKVHKLWIRGKKSAQTVNEGGAKLWNSGCSKRGCNKRGCLQTQTNANKGVQTQTNADFPALWTGPKTQRNAYKCEQMQTNANKRKIEESHPLLRTALCSSPRSSNCEFGTFSLKNSGVSVYKGTLWFMHPWLVFTRSLRLPGDFCIASGSVGQANVSPQHLHAVKI